MCPCPGLQAHNLLFHMVEGGRMGHLVPVDLGYHWVACCCCQGEERRQGSHAALVVGHLAGDLADVVVEPMP